MKVERIPDRPELRLDGDFGGDVGPSLEARLGSLLDEAGEGDREPVVLDLAGVGYMDSAGFSVWIKLERQVRARGRELRVRNARPLIEELFRFADLEDALLS